MTDRPRCNEAATRTPEPVREPSASATQREIDSRTLLGHGKTVTIRHGAEFYTLRLTRANKLILTK
ncbi:MAG: hemin uptake protein HemP [Pseudomonadota bacterium]